MTTATQTSTAASSPEIQVLLDERLAKIEALKADNAILESVLGKKDKDSKALRDSAGGRKANRVKEIKDLELDLAAEGEDIEPFVSQAVGVKSRSMGLSQADLEANLAKVARVFKTTTFEMVKGTADQRIQALLKAAEKSGFKVTDPR